MSVEVIKVLILAESLVSGVKRSVLELLQGLKGDELFEIHVGIPRSRKALYGDSSLDESAKIIAEMGFTVKQFHLEKDGGLKNFIISYREIIKYVREKEIKIIDSHNYYAGLVGRFVAKKCYIRSSHTPHLFNFYKAKGLNKIRYFLQEYIWSFFFTDKIIAVSHSEFDEMSWIFREQIMTTICNSININNHAINKSKNKQFVVGTLGRIEHEKCIDDIAIAAEELREVTFTIAGDGSLLDIYREKYKHVDNIKFYGFVKEPRNNFFPHIDVYLHPSLYEGLSYSILEALESGKPIITTDAPGNRDSIIDQYNGYLVPIRAPSDIVKKLKNYINQPSILNTHSKNSRKHCIKNFSNEIRAFKVKKLWTQMTKGNNESFR